MSSGLVLEVASRFVVKTWHDGAIVYDTVSGDTHVLEPFALAIAERLTQDGKTDAEFLDALVSRFHLSIDEVADLVPIAVANLQQIGILSAEQRDSR